MTPRVERIGERIYFVIGADRVEVGRVEAVELGRALIAAGCDASSEVCVRLGVE